MAMQFSKLTENSSLDLEKFRKKPKIDSNMKSFWAFLISIFFYIYIFHVFKLSASSLLYTTKFWFVISNTLILIIAADFGSFSSKQHDLYEQYVTNTISSTTANKNTVPSFQAEYMKFSQNGYVPCNNNYDHKRILEHREKFSECPEEKIIGVVSGFDQNGELLHLDREDRDQDNVEDDALEGEFVEKKQIEAARVENINVGEIEEADQAKCGGSISIVKLDKKKLINNGPAKEIVVQRIMSERRDGPKGGVEEDEEEEEEFSRMSDEELNRRVEEFIERCNRQIRLQAAHTRHCLDSGSI